MELKTSDVKYMVIEEAKKLVETQEVKLSGLGKYDGKRYYLETAINELCNMILITSIDLAEPEEADGMNGTFAVRNLINESGRVYLRIVSDTCPCQGAAPADPGLEDVYLYYFGTEK